MSKKLNHFGDWYDEYSYWTEIDEVGLPLAICKDAYIEALVWVMKRGMHHYGNDFLTDMTKLSKDIQIELGVLNERGEVIR